jgi:hypothetical protein
MEDPPLQDVPLPPLPPARSRSRRLAAKGKAPAEAPAAPAALPQQSGSTSKGKKRRVATPESESNGDDLFSAEVEDAAADGDDDTPHKAGQLSGVPRVEVEHPSPPSPSSPPRKIRKVIHIGMLDVHVSHSAVNGRSGLMHVKGAMWPMHCPEGSAVHIPDEGSEYCGL